MKWKADSEYLKPRSYEIREDLPAGFYLYVFENGRCIDKCLQDTLEIIKEQARDDFGVPMDAWIKIEE